MSCHVESNLLLPSRFVVMLANLISHNSGFLNRFFLSILSQACKI